MTVSGGSKKIHYRISVNDTRIEGVAPNTSLKRNNLALAWEQKVGQNILGDGFSELMARMVYIVTFGGM